MVKIYTFVVQTDFFYFEEFLKFLSNDWKFTFFKLRMQDPISFDVKVLSVICGTTTMEAVTLKKIQEQQTSAQGSTVRGVPSKILLHTSIR